MDRIKLIPLGTLIEIEIQSTLVEKCKCSLVGMSEGRFLMLAFPSADRYPLATKLISSNIPVVVRLMLEGEIAELIAFKSEIISTLAFPSKLFFIRFPEQLQIHNLRKESRVKLNLAATLNASGDAEQSVAGTVNDLSNAGCCFTFKVHSDKARVHKELVEMKVSLPGGQSVVLKGCIKNQRNQPNTFSDGRSVFLGIELENSQESQHIISFLGLAAEACAEAAG